MGILCIVWHLDSNNSEDCQEPAVAGTLSGSLARQPNQWRKVVEIIVNNQVHEVDVEPEMPLLWVLRDMLNLKGTKFSCGIAQCGACTVHVDGEPIRSCSLPVGAVEGRRITTIEGLSDDSSHPLQQAWIRHQVPQCGYCQSGQIMAAAALLAKIPNPTDADINNAMTNICRCGTYKRIREAIHDVAGGFYEVAMNDGGNNA
jgi:isoquinoline 1-oxidoreductase alpha subunit